MSSTLPDLLDPWRAADAGAEYAGTAPLSRLLRLSDALASVDGNVEFRLVFTRDEEHRAIVRGEVGARLRLICQRCMEPFDQDVKASMALALVSGLDQARELPERYDPLLVTAHAIRPLELVEDELLLALPQIPKHGPGECVPQASRSGVYPEEEKPGNEHPFSVLAGWKARPGG